MFCPNCKSEYKEGIRKCADCDVDLVEKLPKNTPPKKPFTIEIPTMQMSEGDDEVVLLTTVSNPVEADLIINMLKNNNIVCFKKDKASGGYMNLYMGYSIYGQDIYINRDDFARAKEICEEVFQKSFEDEDENEVEEEPIDVPPYRNAKIVSRIILGVAVGMIVLVWIMNYIL